MKDFWEQTEIDAVDLINDVKQGKVTIPSFQRGVVWKPEQSRLLIDSIKKGFPFGSILIYKDEKNHTQLIDGLQRSITVYDFITKPADYFNNDDVDESAVREIIKIGGINNSIETIKSKMYDEITKWIKKNHENMESIQGMQFRDLADELAKNFGFLIGKEKKVAELLQPMMKKFQKLCKSLSDTKIPALVYKGNSSNLPTIFERINREGTKLNKYQIYAASWTNYKIKISDTRLQELVSIVADRYDKLGGKGKLKVDNYDSTVFKRDAKLNVFELGYAFGKYLYIKYSDLFGNDTKPNDISSLGFNLINACLMRKASEMPYLNENIKLVGSDNDINQFLIQILNSIEFIQPILNPLYAFKGNKRTKNFSPPHTELQIVSIIAQAYKIRYVEYELDDNNILTNPTYLINRSKTSWKEDKKLIKSNLIAYYVSDILNDVWKGTGDKRLNDILLSQHDHYIKNYNIASFTKEFELWYEKTKDNRNERDKVAAPSDADKVILNIIYAQEFTAQQHLDSSKYDIEHLCTKKLMKTLLKDRPGLGLPISSIGNLCLLPEYNNRAKQDKLIYDDINYLGKLNITEIENKYTFTTKSDFDWIELQSSNDVFKNSYIDFLDRRFEKIKEKVIKSLFDHVEDLD